MLHLFQNAVSAVVAEEEADETDIEALVEAPKPEEYSLKTYCLSETYSSGKVRILRVEFNCILLATIVVVLYYISRL